jgi:class 3 adenylate cyclase
MVKAVLVSRQTESLGQEYYLGESPVSIGRAADNDIVLPSLAVSRYHVKISWTGSQYMLEDLNSRNGTWINAKRVSGETHLADGDSITFGELKFSFRQLDASSLTRPIPVARSGVVTVLFTDVESSTATRRRLGDARAQETIRVHNAIVREALSQFSGKEIKQTGDGIMASFLVVSQALDCAVVIQRGITAHVENDPSVPLRVYIGLNAGEPIAEEEDLFGTSVDLAARICQHAEAGQILVSDVVRQLAAGKGFLFSDKGEAELRGFEDPIKLWELSWRHDG